MTVYSFITAIEADSDEAAEEARSEVVQGGIEDARESGNFPDGVEVGADDLVKKDLGEVLTRYRAFHDWLGDLVESGKVHSFRDSQPAAYAEMIEMMADIKDLDLRDPTERMVGQ